MEGYDAKFDPPLEKRLECPICLLAQREPMQTPCGHRFCSACILRALRETGPRCPVDNTAVCIHQLFKDNFAKREVLSLNVHCSADHCGCAWQGELRELQVHNKQCELVLVECPNSCGHSCRRSNLQEHIANCSNRPSQCSTCSISFPRSSLSDHQPHCSHIVLPDTVAATLNKGGEILKWAGHLKLKLNGQVTQVTGYLTAPVDSEESYLSTGCWCSTISLITLNSLASHIFSRILTSSEVQPVVLNFSLLTSDANSLAFQKIFRRKPEICNAAVCLRLRPGNRRAMRELTIMYMCWCEQRKRLQAYIANLKTHLVRQIQTHLHDMQSSRRHRQRVRSSLSSHVGRHHTTPSQSQSRISTNNAPSHAIHHLHSHSHPHVHVPRQPHHPPSALPGIPPPQMINIQPMPPHNDMQSVVHPPMQHHVIAAAAAAGNSPSILPSLLSWQMSQSFNTYPWRMQATGVPFFTFPSTPPSYIPANSYPYTFAPLPAAPFSISPMQPVPSTVHMPSYNGLSVMVPQVTTVDANAVTLPANQGNIVTQGYPVAPPTAVAGPSQPVLDRDLQAVAVTLSGEGNTQVLHLLQPRSNPHPDHQIYRQSMTQAPLSVAAATAPPALILTEPQLPPTTEQNTTGNNGPISFEFLSLPANERPTQPPPQAVQNTTGNVPFAFEVVPIPTEHQPPPPPQQNNVTSFPYEVVTTQAVHRSDNHHFQNTNSSSGGTFSFNVRQAQQSQHMYTSHVQSTLDPQLSVVNLDDDAGVIWGDIPGPSGLNQDQHPMESESSSSRDSTPDVPRFHMFSPDNDSESDVSATPDLSVSPTAIFDESTSLLSSDQDDSSADDTPHDISTDSSTASALHTLADAAAILADSSITPVSSAPTTRSTTGPPLRLPVLINISDSESDSRLSPSSIIDLTHSPTASNRRDTSSTLSDPYNYSVIVSAADGTSRSTAPSHSSSRRQSIAHQQESVTAPGIRHSDSRISAVIVPVIHHWNGGPDHQALRQIQPYVPSDQPMGVVQAAPVRPVGVEEAVARMVHSTASRTSETPVMAAVQLQQPGYSVQEYSNRTAPTAVASWPAELPTPRHPVQHALLYPPTQQPVSNTPHGDFWDTVIPSLDMTLQSSANAEN